MSKFVTTKSFGLGSVAVLALVATASSAFAGGFAIREQSTESQGASFAGNAAGTGISVMYWNPAGAANKTGPGINTESNFAVIVPKATVNVESVSPGSAGGNLAYALAPNSSEIGHNAIVPASYGSYQLNQSMFLGLGINSGFGLGTEPKTADYDGAVIGRRGQVFTAGATPTLAYVVSPLLTIGVGAQVNYMKATFKFATAIPQGPSTAFSGDDVAFGGTAGIMLTPGNGTRIGLGWRSALNHTVEGEYSRPAVAAFGVTALVYKGSAVVKLPDIVTLSLRQEVSSNARVMATVEWTNWSLFNELRVKDTTGVNADVVVPTAWSNSTFYSIGGEYDYSKQLTVRTGVAYEYSPIDDPKKRLIGIPDSNRIWLSLGGNYKLTEVTSVDLAYTHVFFQDSTFERSPVGSARVLKGSIEASTDIISLGVKSKF